ncbi:MAG: hypothetical protein HY332_02050 [Chloroflexi bacterium]|nr:hypothetical protein [Chloroflexota bacterium]
MNVSPVMARIGVHRRASAVSSRLSLFRRVSWPDAIAVLGLTLLAAWHLWPAAGSGRLPQNLDFMLQYVPNAAYLARSLADGRVPLWNPYLGTGMPFAADPGTGTWYLPNWLPLSTLPLYAAVRAIIWVHLIWAALGCYLYLRSVLRTGPTPSWIGAVSFALTTWLPGLAGMAAVLTAISWLPWLLLLGHLATARRGPWIAVLGIAGALQLAAGWPVASYLSWALLGLLTMAFWIGDTVGRPHPSPRPLGDGATGRRGARSTGCRPLAHSPTRSLASHLLPLAFGALVAAILAGILLVPAAEFVAETNYAETRPLERVHTEGYLMLLSWFRPAGGTGSLESSQLYVGVVPLLLALTGLAFGRRRHAVAFGVVLLVALVAAMGTHAPLFGLLYRWLPGFRTVYLPARVGLVAAFALACLAALGAERLASARWTARHAAVVAASAALFVPLVFGQFWLSEGYDNFRRLLTNTGRFTGGPFLTQAQEAHYIAFGGLALLAIGLAARLPRAWTLAAALVLTTADLGLARSQAAPAGFDPEPWYRPAIETGRQLATMYPHERVTGLQWHGTQHFLNDFPRSAAPAQLPPNLALLTGVRDAQAYNPLLLRRAVYYFSRAARGQKDDHWLRIDDFYAPEVRRLAVRNVLVGGGGGSDGVEWRVTDRRLSEPVVVPAGGATQVVWQGAPKGATQVRVVSYLGEATGVPQDTPAIRLTLETASGEEVPLVLRAGRETAEWAYGRPDVRRIVQHRQAPIALETRIASAVGGAFSVFEYLATFALHVPIEVRAIHAQMVAPGVTGYVEGVWVTPPDADIARPAEGTLALAGALPRLRIEGGSVDLQIDEPERIVARVVAPRPGALVLADAFYPGWKATIGGYPVPIEVADGLFRSVSLPVGEHEVAFVYRPTSLRLGAMFSVTGILVVLLILFVPFVRRPAPR